MQQTYRIGLQFGQLSQLSLQLQLQTEHDRLGAGEWGG